MDASDEEQQGSDQEEATQEKEQDSDQDEEVEPGRSLAGLRFTLRDCLIYFVDFEHGREKLCVPKALEKEVFQSCHDSHMHAGFHRTYARVQASFFIHTIHQIYTICSIRATQA